MRIGIYSVYDNKTNGKEGKVSDIVNYTVNKKGNGRDKEEITTGRPWPGSRIIDIVNTIIVLEYYLL